MPRVHFGTKDEPGIDLKESTDMIAVRTRSKRSIQQRGAVPLPTAADVVDGELVASFDDAGVEVFRVPPAARSVDDRKKSLRAAPDVRFAGSVLVNKAGEPVVYTENIYIRFKDDADADACESVIRDAGLTVKQRLDFADNAYFAEAPEGTGQQVFDIANKLLKRADVVYCHPELVQVRALKQIFPPQWHLKETTIGSVSVKAHANVEAAHAITQGSGITIAVIDDGCDLLHQEFSSSGKIVSPRDASAQTNDPRPKSGDNHGTACSGVACASGIEGASGVAPLARLMPIRLASGLGSMREAEAFKWAADHGADVISCSWGPADGKWFDPADPVHTRFVALAASTRDAIDYCVTNGRGGKGCVIFFAAGNGNESVEMDGYASYQNVIAVAACNDTGKRSVYSDFGDAIACAFPSSDFGHVPFSHPEPLTTGIWTTDRSGPSGYNSGDINSGDAAGDFTNDFGGTSSSAPGAAGVAALVLAANSSLRWTDVRDILKRTCDKIDPGAGAYDGAGHSKFYGFGRLNAEAAVKAATAVPGLLSITRKLVNAPIPDLGRVEQTLDIGDEAPIEKLAVHVRITHTYIGDLVVTLIPPSGRSLPSVVLHNRTGGRTQNIDRMYDASTTPGLSAFAGKKCNGTWTFRVEDKAAQDAGTLIQIELQLSLPPATPGASSAAPHAVSGNGRARSSRAKLAQASKTGK
jgi:subtilisin family serine protease